MGIKNSIPRLDAVDKVTGAAKYTEDLIPINALVGKTLHSTIAKEQYALLMWTRRGRSRA